jgi:hypothetical protein
MRAEKDDPSLADLKIGYFVYTSAWRTQLNPPGIDVDRFIVTKLTPKGFWCRHDNHKFGNGEFSEDTDTLRELRPMSWHTDTWASFTSTRRFRSTEELAHARLLERTNNYIEILEKRLADIKTRAYMLEQGRRVAWPRHIFDSDY